MSNVGTATVEVIPSMEGFSVKLQSQMQTSGSSGGIAFGTSFLTGFASRIVQGTVISAVVQPIIDTVLNLGKQALFGFNAQMQQAQVGFTTMLGDADAAKKMLADLVAFANATPFDASAVITYAERMMAMGIAAQDVIPDLTAIGDAVAALGTGTQGIDAVTKAIGQMQSTGHVMAQDMLQLTQAGIPAWAILADKLGVTEEQLRKMVTAGDVASSTAIPALISGLEHGTSATAAFGGMMDKQSHTMVGALSNLKDTIVSTIGADTAGLFDSLSGKVANLAQWVSDGGFQDGLKKVKDWASGTFGDDLKKIGDGFQHIANFAKEVWTDIGPLVGSGLIETVHLLADAFDLIAKALDKVSFLAGPVLAAILAWKTAAAVAAGIEALGTAITVLKDAQLALTATQGLKEFIQALALMRDGWYAVAVAEAVADALDPVTWIVLAVAAVVALAVGIYELATRTRFFQTIWEGLKTAGLAVAHFFTGPFMDAVHAVADFFSGPFLTPFKAVGNFFTQTIPSWIGTVVAFFEALPGQVWNAILALPQIVLSIMEQLAYDAGYAVGLIVKFFLSLPEFFVNLWNTVSATVVQWWHDTVSFVAQLWDDVTHAVVAGIAAVVGFFEALPGQIEHAISVLPGLVLGVIATAWDWITARVIEGVNATVGFFESLPGRAVTAISDLGTLIGNAFSGALDWLKQAGRDVVQGLINGISSMWDNVTNLAKDLGGKVVSGFKDAMGIHSPSKVMAQMGAYTMQGLQQGLIKAAPAVLKTMDQVTNGLLGVTPASALASAQTRVGTGAIKVLNYYAAPGSSISSEEDLFAAAGRARMVF